MEMWVSSSAGLRGGAVLHLAEAELAGYVCEEEAGSDVDEKEEVDELLGVVPKLPWQGTP